ncbi:STAS domain-containing protein [Massilia sp. CCM 8734]|uniref:STAS domain-containing protein n=1 Tax=Massilia sp. CCM 8734 TaxID=2609283 RepID=UPI001421F9F0|nr:STAS domain-containing protein [Massilia sp. CCM 8734]NHZ97418.1 hypothetical protein [Massilia sp. CCM 8734]
MGIFSIFNKKKTEQPGAKNAPDSRLRVGEPSRLAADTDADRARQREIARATAAKIDAIESAMSNDIFNTPEPAWGSGPRKAKAAAADGATTDTLPMLELATTELLADEDLPDALVAPQTAPVIEEIAIMFANDQMAVTEHLLLDSLVELGKDDRTIWWMLFDLYQVGGRQEDFDNIAIDYASQFETSPPSWSPPLMPPGMEERTFAGVTPTEVFSGVLDGEVAPRLERLLQRASENPVLRLEFARIQSVTPDGCALLLETMNRLRASDRELIVAGAAELAELVHSTIEIGQRDASEAPWLLLLALFQLLDREKDFEETAMDYCVTYEVSPPSFEPSLSTATSVSILHTPPATDGFMLPSVIEGSGTALFDAIDAYAADSAETVLFDCSRLARVDYSAAAALLNRLRPIAAEKKIELRELNHLVAALFKLLGFTEVAKLFPHKY